MPKNEKGSYMKTNGFKLVVVIALVAIMGFTFVACSGKKDGGSADGGKKDSVSASSGKIQYAPESDFQVRTIDGGKGVEIIEYIGDKREVNIPPKIQDLPVIRIRGEAFDNKQLTKITIPDSVTEIGHHAFMSNQLTSVTIPNSVTEIRGFPYNQLTSVTISNRATYIGDRAFAYNQLTSIIIPNSVERIDRGAFKDNPLTSITIGDHVALNMDTDPFDGYFEDFYMLYYSSSAGTYTRPDTDSTTWTKQ
jgi:hypothetical protein